MFNHLKWNPSKTDSNVIFQIFLHKSRQNLCEGKRNGGNLFTGARNWLIKFRIEQKSCTQWNDEIVCRARYPVCLISTIELNKIACLCCFCWCISRSSWQFGATQWWQHQRIPAFTFRFQNGHQVSPFGTNTDISSNGYGSYRRW